MTTLPIFPKKMLGDFVVGYWLSFGWLKRKVIEVEADEPAELISADWPFNQPASY